MSGAAASGTTRGGASMERRIESVSKKPITESDVGAWALVTVAAIEVMPHSRGSCRHCGEPFEQLGGAYGCGCSGLSRCPRCGCPVTPPLNRDACEV